MNKKTILFIFIMFIVFTANCKAKKVNSLKNIEKNEKWTSYGFRSEEIRNWKNHFFSIEQAERWKTYKFSPKEAKKWKSYGFGCESAYEWRNLFLTFNKAKEWVSIGITNAYEANEWHKIGIDAKEADEWRKLEFTSIFDKSPDKLISTRKFAEICYKNNINSKDFKKIMSNLKRNCGNVFLQESFLLESPYEIENKCFAISVDNIQLLNKSKGLYTLDNGGNYSQKMLTILLDFKEKYAPKIKSMVIVKGEKPFKYVTIQGQQKIIHSMKVLQTLKTP